MRGGGGGGRARRLRAAGRGAGPAGGGGPGGEVEDTGRAGTGGARRSWLGEGGTDELCVRTVHAFHPGTCGSRALARGDVPPEQALDPQTVVGRREPHLVELGPDRSPLGAVEQ